MARRRRRTASVRAPRRIRRDAGEVGVARPVSPAAPDEQGRPAERQPGRPVGCDDARHVDEPPAPPDVRHVVEPRQAGGVAVECAGQHGPAHHLVTGVAVVVGGTEDVQMPVRAEPVERNLERPGGEPAAVRGRDARGNEPATGADERQADAGFRRPVGRPGDAVPEVGVRPRVAEQEPQAPVVLERRPEIGPDDAEPGRRPVVRRRCRAAGPTPR